MMFVRPVPEGHAAVILRADGTTRTLAPGLRLVPPTASGNAPFLRNRVWVVDLRTRHCAITAAPLGDGTQWVVDATAEVEVVDPARCVTQVEDRLEPAVEHVMAAVARAQDNQAPPSEAALTDQVRQALTTACPGFGAALRTVTARVRRRTG